MRTGKPQFVVHGHKNSVISIAMSEVGGFLATGSGDWQARLFKINGLEAPVAKPHVTNPISSSVQSPSSTKQQTTTGVAAGVNAEGARDAAKKDLPSSEANGHDRSKESSSASASTSAVPAAKEAAQASSAPVRDVTPSTAAPTSQTVPPVTNAPSSPSAMKVDVPATSSVEKAPTNTDAKPSDGSAEIKDTAGETNGDTKMADSPAPPGDSSAKA